MPTESNPTALRAGRLARKIWRRAAGFVLLCIVVGMTTCSALDHVRDNALSRAQAEGERS